MVIKQAVILAAGNGKRMKENATDDSLRNLPKPLLDLNGRPMIEGKLKALVENGVEVCIVINPAYESVFKEKLKGYDIRYCHQAEPLGTANALYAAKEFVRDELFLVMMGDDLVIYDMESTLNSSEPGVFGFSVDEVSGYGALEIDENGNVLDIIEKQSSGKGTVNCGVYIMHKTFFDCYDEIKLSSSGEHKITDAPKLLSKRGVTFKLKKMDYWHGINTPNELRSANQATPKSRTGFRLNTENSTTS